MDGEQHQLQHWIGIRGVACRQYVLPAIVRGTRYIDGLFGVQQAGPRLFDVGPSRFSYFTRLWSFAGTA